MKKWHITKADRELADIIVKSMGPEQWFALANYLGKPYPHSLAQKYMYCYEWWGCKEEEK